MQQQQQQHAAVGKVGVESRMKGGVIAQINGQKVKKFYTQKVKNLLAKLRRHASTFCKNTLWKNTLWFFDFFKTFGFVENFWIFVRRKKFGRGVKLFLRLMHRNIQWQVGARDTYVCKNGNRRLKIWAMSTAEEFKRTLIKTANYIQEFFCHNCHNWQHTFQKIPSHIQNIIMSHSRLFLYYETWLL